MISQSELRDQANILTYEIRNAIVNELHDAFTRGEATLEITDLVLSGSGADALMMNGASRDGAMVTYRFSDYPEVAVKFFAHPCTEEYVLGQPWPALQRR